MKLSPLPVLFLLSAMGAQADVSIVAGYVYDVGKGSYSSDPEVRNKNDNNLCWAATAANVFQHWQDWYLDWYIHPEDYPDVFPPAEPEPTVPDETGGNLSLSRIWVSTGTAQRWSASVCADEEPGTETPVDPGTDTPEEPGTETEPSGVKVPDGFAETSYTRPSGTQYLNIYNDFATNFKNDGGLLYWATDWYFDGKKESSIVKADAAAGGYLPDTVDTYSAVFGWHFNDIAGLQEVMDIPLHYAGLSMYLGIITPSGGGHAITCWGYETDADGKLNAVYVTDSDDKQYGARRVEVAEENGKLTLSSPFPGSAYSSGTYTINEVSFIGNKGAIYVKDGNFVLEELPEDGKIDQALDITGRKLSSPTGISTQPESMLVSSGGKGTSLTLGGGAERVEGNGFTALAGSMVSLNNAAVRVSGFAGDGISVGCEVNLCGGSVSISGNGGTGISVQGTEDDPRAYLRMNDNRTVDISGNDKGVLYVGKNSLNVALLQHNRTVAFSGNGAAAQDAVIYNAGTLAIEDNRSVTFSGNTAKYDIYNAGKLTLVANEGQRITFQHGVKNSATSTATLGAGEAGTYAFKDGDQEVSLTLSGATIKKGGSMLWDADACTLTLSDVAFTGDVTFNLGYFADMNQLDLTGATFASGSTVSFILDLGSEAGKKTDFTFFGYPWADMEESDLTKVYVNMGDYFTGDTSVLDGVNLALTVTGTIADDAMLIIDTDGFDLDRNDVDVPDCIYRRTADGRHYYNAPEPATATLTLLALAALAVRRRRSVKY